MNGPNDGKELDEKGFSDESYKADYPLGDSAEGCSEEDIKRGYGGCD